MLIKGGKECLSNMYLYEMDVYMQERGLNWIRYADNIYVYENDQKKAWEIYQELCNKLKCDFELQINEKRSGVFDVFAKNILGYQFVNIQGNVEVRRVQFQLQEKFENWNSCNIQRVNHEYHIVQEGILTKKDYGLLFENEEKKYYIPVEIVDQINFYSNIIISSQVLNILSEKDIKISFFDKYGNLKRCYVPAKHCGDAKVLIKQCKLYGSKDRLVIAKKMEKAAIHNMRANLRYYNKKKDMSEYIMFLSKYLEEIDACVTVEELLLVEARVREKYYQSFNRIIKNAEFRFASRSKRPPKDELNALISFGNTLLYNIFYRLFGILRLTHVLVLYLVHVQRSVFEGQLTDAKLNSLKKEIRRVASPEEDAVCIYQIENMKYAKKEHLGTREVFSNII